MSSFVFRNKKVLAAVTALFFLSAVPAFAVIDQGKWGAYWKETKNDYKKIVKEKKPSGGFFYTSGIDKALKKVDQAYGEWDDDKFNPKTFTAFKKAVAGFRKAGRGYAKKLDKALAKTKKGSLKKKGIKFLKRTLAQIEDDLDGAVETSRITAESDMAALSKTAKITARTFKQSLSAIKAGLTKLKSNPTVAMWEKLKMSQMCRDMQNSFVGARRDKMDPPGGIEGAFKKIEVSGLAGLKKAVKKFEGDARKKEEKRLVLAKYKEIKTLVKKANAYYKGTVAAYLK